MDGNTFINNFYKEYKLAVEDTRGQHSGRDAMEAVYKRFELDSMDTAEELVLLMRNTTAASRFSAHALDLAYPNLCIRVHGRLVSNDRMSFYGVHGLDAYACGIIRRMSKGRARFEKVRGAIMQNGKRSPNTRISTGRLMELWPDLEIFKDAGQAEQAVENERLCMLQERRTEPAAAAAHADKPVASALPADGLDRAVHDNLIDVVLSFVEASKADPGMNIDEYLADCSTLFADLRRRCCGSRMFAAVLHRLADEFLEGGHK